MRIAALISDEVTYQPLVYGPLFRERAKDFVGVVIVPFATRHMPPRKMAVFLWHLYGIRGCILKSWQVLRNKLMNLLHKVRLTKARFSVPDLAAEQGIPVFRCGSLKDPDTVNLLKELAPDVILSSQGHIVPRSILEIPRIGVINKHAGMLPRYRGLYPVFWALLNGEKEIGVTVHEMNEGLDDGPIICQEAIPVGPGATFESLYREVVRLTPVLYLKALDKLENGDSARLPNDRALSTAYSVPGRGDIRRLKKMGIRIL